MEDPQIDHLCRLDEGMTHTAYCWPLMFFVHVALFGLIFGLMDFQEVTFLLGV